MTVRAPEPGIGFTVRVAGRLDARWAARFDGCTLTAGDDGTTTLAGTASDQSELHGVLNRIRDLGIALIALETVPQRSR